MSVRGVVDTKHCIVAVPVPMIGVHNGCGRHGRNPPKVPRARTASAGDVHDQRRSGIARYGAYHIGVARGLTGAGTAGHLGNAQNLTHRDGQSGPGGKRFRPCSYYDRRFYVADNASGARALQPNRLGDCHGI